MSIKFQAGDVASYQTLEGETRIVTVVDCPDNMKAYRWATKDDVVWSVSEEDGHPHWMGDHELTLVCRQLPNPTNRATMGISTDTGTNMNINRATASTILDMLEDRSISNITDDQLEAILALRKIANKRYVDLFVNMASTSSFVEGIKMIRAVTGLGLKDAKDLYEQFDPRHNGGLIGPILHEVEIEEAEHLLAKYNTLGAGVVLTLGM